MSFNPALQGYCCGSEGCLCTSTFATIARNDLNCSAASAAVTNPLSVQLAGPPGRTGSSRAVPRLFGAEMIRPDTLWVAAAALVEPARAQAAITSRSLVFH